MSMASAETIQFGNYTATFDMKQPHIIDHNAVRTFYGTVMFLAPSEETPLNSVPIIDNVYVNGQQMDFGSCLNGWYLIPFQNEYQVFSQMNLTSTLDFLMTLKIQKN